MPDAGPGILAVKAMGWGLLAASSFLIGGFLGITVKTSARTRAAMMAFGGGALLYAAVIEGLQDATDEEAWLEERWTVAGFSFLGALLFVGLEWGLESIKDKLGLQDLNDLSEGEALGEEGGDAVATVYQNMGLGGRIGELHAAVQGRALVSYRSTSGSLSASIGNSPNGSTGASLQGSTKRPASTPSKAMLTSVNEHVAVELVGSSRSQVQGSDHQPSVAQASLRYNDNEDGATSARVSAMSEQDRKELMRGRQASLLFIAASFIDAIPESIVIGIFSNDGDLSTLVVFVLGVFLAQLPLAMSAAEKMLMCGVSPVRIMLMLAPITLWTGLGAMIGSFAFPGAEGEDPDEFTSKKFGEAAMEGLAGGMLLSLVANTILPEAFAEAGSQGSLVGFCTMLGFLSLLLVALFISYFE